MFKIVNNIKSYLKKLSLLGLKYLMFWFKLMNKSFIKHTSVYLFVKTRMKRVHDRNDPWRSPRKRVWESQHARSFVDKIVN